MVTGTLEVEFILHGCQNLKEKRSIVKRIIDRTRNQFKVAIAEVDCLDLHQKGLIGVAVVSNNRRLVNSLLDQIIDYIENLNLVDITDTQINFF